MLLLLYSLRLGVVLGGSVATRIFESLAAAIMGALSAIAWNYAIRSRRLLHDDVSADEAMTLSNRILAEPRTALLTIPFAFAGPFLWEIAW